MTTSALTRRGLLAGAIACLLAPPVLAEARLGEDGLYHQPWISETFLDLAEDLEAATRAGKRLAVVVEQRGCPYCREMHTVILADPAIGGWIRDNFDLVQLDLHGGREVTDFDGSRLPEKAFAARYGVRITPTVLFFPISAAGLAEKAPADRPVTRMPGLLRAPDFIDLFRRVRERG